MYRGLVFTLFIAASIALVTFAPSTHALELPKPQPVEKYLGKSASGVNYTVRPIVRSDGVMRIFDVDTPYGQFAFDGVEFTKLRLHELDAVAAIEKMSQSEAFGQAFGRAALGPIKFGADLITKPADTVERSLSGIGNMFDRIGAGLSNTRADRDNLVESLLGVSDTQRELAVSLDVDPYTDFPPLAQRLKEMANIMAGGGRLVFRSWRHRDCRFIGRDGEQRERHAARQDRGAGDCRGSRYACVPWRFGRKRKSTCREPELYAGRPSDHGAGAETA